MATTSSAKPDPRAAQAEQRRIEDQYVAGVEHFVALAGAQPEMSRAAFWAASAGLEFCERARPAFVCVDANVKRLDQVMHVMAPRVLSVPAVPPVAWTLEGPPACAPVVAVLAATTAPQAALHATLTLRECQFTSTHTAWTAGRCQSAAACRDGSPPTREMADCAPGQPCQPPPPTCPCQVASLPSHIDVRGTWTFDGHEQPFTYTRDGTQSLVTDRLGVLPEPQDEPLLGIAQRHLGSQLTVASLGLAVLHAVDPDDLALRCANLRSADAQQDVLGATVRARVRCATAYLRDPATPPTVAAPACHPAGPPKVQLERYPYRVRVVDECERAAIKSEIERRSPGWTVEVGVLGFVLAGSLAHAPGRLHAVLAAATAFAAANHPYLGFDHAPAVFDGGESSGGRRIVMGDPGPTVVLRTTNDQLELGAHAWPVTCPAINEAALLAPWLGTPIAITTPGTPCDRVGNHACGSTAPSERPARLARRDVSFEPRFVLAPSDRADQLELHCAVEIRLQARIESRGPRRLPAVVDAVTGAALEPSLREDRRAAGAPP